MLSIWSRAVLSSEDETFKDALIANKNTKSNTGVTFHFYPVAIASEYQETLATFFQHNMQVNETAHALFLHRNTLLYRLEKIREQTCLDPRAFPEAVLLWIMLSLAKIPK